MIQGILNWLDARTRYRRLLAPIRHRTLPQGPSFAYTTGAVIFWLFVAEVVTGLLMMGTYCPSVSDSWASVFYIESLSSGHFLRGLHYWIAQALIVLCALHAIRVLIVAAFRAPHEITWITGLFLLPMIVIWAITGNPLSGSMEGFAQIETEAQILRSIPIVGPPTATLLLGGDSVGILTMTHLYYLHVAAMPIAFGLILLLHISQIYRHGLADRKLQNAVDFQVPYYPHQTVRNMFVLLVAMGVLSWLAFFKGAPFHAPADPLLAGAQPRPVWYFLSIFELRHYMVGQWEFVATVVIPGAIMGIMILFPFIDRRLSNKVSFCLRGLIVLGGVVGVVGLSAMSLQRDVVDEEYQKSVERAEKYSERSRELAARGEIPPIGAVALLRSDPKTQGPLLYEKNCAGCHPYHGPDGKPDADGVVFLAEKPAGANLYAIGTAEWNARWMNPKTIRENYANTALEDGEMVNWVADLYDEYEGEEAVAELKEMVDQAAVALAAEAALPGAAPLDEKTVSLGASAIVNDFSCIDCHKFGDEGDLGVAPDLTGYASREWLIGIISNPEHKRFYPERPEADMPAYCPSPKDPKQNLLTPQEVELLADWLRRDWYEPPKPQPVQEQAVEAEAGGALDVQLGTEAGSLDDAMIEDPGTGGGAIPGDGSTPSPPDSGTTVIDDSM